MAFHPYPQLIPSVFNLSGFAPPQSLTSASHWPWVDHPASGLDHATHNALFRLAFATTTPHGLTSRRAADSQAHSSKGTPSPQKKALTDCKHTVSGTISLPSRGTFHHSLTVLSAIGHRRYSGLPGGPGRFTADSTSPLLLGDKRNQQTMAFTYRALTVYGRRFHALSANHNQIGAQLADHAHVNPTTPHTQPLPGITRMRFSLIRVRSPLLTESQLFSLPTGTEMFHFPA